MQSGISAKKSDTQTLIFGKKDKQGKKRRIKKGSGRQGGAEETIIS